MLPLHAMTARPRLPSLSLSVARHFLLAAPLLLAACDIPGLGPDPRIAQREADGKAIGSACRHALRGIEDCYVLNEKASKTAVFAGWKEMDLYMRENKIEGQRATAVKAEPVEEVMEDKKPKTGKSDKATDSKPKMAAAKAATKEAAH
jgi:hypothetical protein